MLKRLFAPLSMVLAIAVYVMPTGQALANEGSNHHLVIHVSDNDKQKMNMAMNNAANVTKFYADKGETVKIEIVAYGPGLMMLRPDKSPVSARITNYAASFDNISFAACGNTMKIMSKKAGKSISIYDFAKKVPSGVTQIMLRQDQGWHYIRP
jgi:hypothetical protein